MNFIPPGIEEKSYTSWNYSASTVKHFIPDREEGEFLERKSRGFIKVSRLAGFF